MRDYRTGFTLRPEHVALLRRAYVGWQNCETGAPEINPKRPYGNSSVALDVAEIIGESVPDEDEDGARAYREWEQKRRPELMQLHRDTELALQIVLCTGSFEPGEYIRNDRYDDRDWKRREPVEKLAKPAIETAEEPDVEGEREGGE